MSKKHFIALADIVRGSNYNIAGEEIENRPFSDYAIRRLADFCESFNPRFNRSRWLGYIAGTCGPNGGGWR